MSDLKLDGAGDLDISSNGFEVVTGVDAIAQELRIRSKQVEGDWFLGLGEGLPYFSRILINGPNFADVYQIYGREFLRATNVVKVQDLKILETPDSSLTISATVLTTEGVIDDLEIAIT